MIYLGLDCGGSSTRALAQDEDGQVLFRGDSGAANLSSTPEKFLAANLRRALTGCPKPDFACGCFAGLLTENDRERVRRILLAVIPNTKWRLEADYAAALAASPEGTHICVVAGTGSLVCSKHNGKVVKSGGRGYLLGDYGSATRFGKQFLQYHLELGQFGQHEIAITDLFGSIDESEIISKLYREGPPAPKLAKLAARFARDASSDEPYALDFLYEEMQRLAQIVISHAEKHFPHGQELNICAAGGLWKISPIYETEFKNRLNELSGGRTIEIHRIRHAPVVGAVILAKEASE